MRRRRRSAGGTASGRWRLDKGRRWPGGGHPDTSGAGQWCSPRRPGSDTRRRASPRRLPSESGWGSRRKGSTARQPCWRRPRKLSPREGDVSVVSRVRCRSCLVISSARVTQRREIDPSVCLADAAGVSREPGRSAAQRASSWRSVSAVPRPLTGQHGPGSDLGIDGVGLVRRAARAPFASIHLHHDALRGAPPR